MAHPQRERLAVVLGAGGQGSGYLLNPWTVVTAAHVVGEEPTAQVAIPGSGGPKTCRVVWRRQDDRCDAALLAAEEDLLPSNAVRGFERLSWGLLNGLTALAGAAAVGFPQVQRSPDRRLDSEQIVGTLKPATGLVSGRPVLDSEHAPPAASADGPPWAGMSGAPVFLDNSLVGLVRSVPQQWGEARLELTLCEEFMLHVEVRRILEDNNVTFTMTSLEPPTDSFEDRLREYLGREWGKVRIYGVTRSGRGDGAWQLDVAYLSLELASSERPQRELGDEDPAPAARRVEDALAQQQRILLRGNAGSGKTTLLQWLTTRSARDELPDQLHQFKDCIPILLKLRTIARPGQPLPGPEEFLKASGNPLAGYPGSEGWVSRRMAEGRVLLMVDGIDEAPAGERRRVREWLTGLLAAYPGVRCLVTTRPSAVREGWLAELGFAELDMLPMSRGDVAAFIDRWHTAAAAAAEGDEEQRERLARWRELLVDAVGRIQDLGRLAANPLMCSLICALNADRQGHLPSGRMALYDAALEMLLVRRDEERGVDPASEGLALSELQQQALLQKLAYWLIRNGQSELSEHQALGRIEHALPQMPQIQGDPGRVLRQLTVRSGVLRQPEPGVVDFVHRTFQDYLGAQAAIEEGDIPMLVDHAHEDQWEDVIRLAVGHARRRERAELLARILRRAEEEPQHAHRLRLLAAACLELAVELDPAVREAVTTAAAALIPPRTTEAAKELADAGPVVLELLPGPEGLDDATAHAVVVCATTIGTERAIPLLAAYADHPALEVRSQLAFSWPRFDTREYGRAVVARLAAREDVRLMVTSRAEAEFLATLPAVHRVEFSGALTEETVRLVPRTDLQELRFHENPYGIDLSLVHDAPTLSMFMLLNNTGRFDLAPLARTAVKRVIVLGCAAVTGLAALGRMTALEHLSLAAIGASQRGELHLPLVLGAPRLASLRLMAPDLTPADWDTLRRHQPLTDLDLEELDLRALTGMAPLPQVHTLHLRRHSGSTALDRVATTFPGLHAVWFHEGIPDVEGLRPETLLATTHPFAPLGTERVPSPRIASAERFNWYVVL
ncbi:NACHT domain-containing protein [Streptacidiphilus fuscans]|uniref:NACHT domain-containing protein n=1 Tax=Streptacidiphilus fuscans TaxID=2789292 RepID=A0A931BAD4_9ACTN|nr:NACHT domain-containing protein [Streptacidiphilus fuscans]MBF9073524.1 NACHT domain-containing protein [Streptacidiphilus fuscans]